ncbi:MAG: calcium-binding protein [Piscinibacter sp.]
MPATTFSTAARANDRLDGGVGADTLRGGAGNDHFIVDDMRDVVVEVEGAGFDTIFSLVKCTLLAQVERLVLIGSGNVGGTGNDLANIIDRQRRWNRLLGGGGIDRIDGGAGADLLAGGTRNDILTGGTGNDRFLFSSALSSVHNVDRITDFEHGSDQLLLSRTVFAGVGSTGPLAAAAFVLGSTAGDANNRIVYDAASGSLYYDADGNGAAAQVLFARLVPGTDLQASDLWVV